MFFKFISLGLVAIGLYHILSKATFLSRPDMQMLEYSAVGLCTIFIGLLNFHYLYEVPSSKLPKIILLAANIIYIGFNMLMITGGTDRIEAWIATAMTIISSLMVINHRV